MRVVPDEITQIDLNWSHAAIDNEDFDDVEDDDASTRPIQINLRCFDRNSTHRIGLDMAVADTRSTS